MTGEPGDDDLAFNAAPPQANVPGYGFRFAIGRRQMKGDPVFRQIDAGNEFPDIADLFLEGFPRTGY